MTEKCAICDKEAVQKCSACKRVRYCSREHQKQHWKEHKKICQPFEVFPYLEINFFFLKFDYQLFLRYVNLMIWVGT